MTTRGPNSKYLWVKRIYFTNSGFGMTAMQTMATKTMSTVTQCRIVVRMESKHKLPSRKRFENPREHSPILAGAGSLEGT
jgi:hypothetical protein